MIKSKGDISAVKNLIAALKDHDVEVKINLGRKKYATFYGIVGEIYPSLFTIRATDGFNGKTSYSYNELMCGNIAVKKLDSDVAK